MSAPWAASIEDESTVAVVVMVRGESHLMHGTSPPTRLGPGDVAVVKGTSPYVIADDPTTSPDIVIEPGQVCRTLSGQDLSIRMGLGVRTWGNGPDGEDVFLTAAYELASQVTGRLLDAIPDVAVVRADEWDGALVRLLTAEMGRDLPGQDVVLDRLADLLLVAAVRQWFSRADATPPQWWQAQADPVVGPVLGLMHDQPGKDWSLDALAAAASVSRATLARRFAEVVGRSPMAYLTEWRLALAADLLRGGDSTVEQVGRRVGYGSPFAFTAAFKRVHGLPPRDFRMRARASAPESQGNLNLTHRLL
jgi:AraC-like DNA-binding protein